MKSLATYMRERNSGHGARVRLLEKMLNTEEPVILTTLEESLAPNMSAREFLRRGFSGRRCPFPDYGIALWQLLPAPPAPVEPEPVDAAQYARDLRELRGYQDEALAKLWAAIEKLQAGQSLTFHIPPMTGKTAAVDQAIEELHADGHEDDAFAAPVTGWLGEDRKVGDVSPDGRYEVAAIIQDEIVVEPVHDPTPPAMLVDIYSLVAACMYGVKLDDVTPALRKLGKHAAHKVSLGLVADRPCPPPPYAAPAK